MRSVLPDRRHVNGYALIEGAIWFTQLCAADRSKAGVSAAS